MLSHVVIRHTCINPGLIDPDKFARIARKLTDNAPHPPLRREAQIDTAGCINSNAPPQVFNLINAADLSNREHFAFARFFVRTGDFEKAINHIKSSLQLPYAGSYIRNAADFRPLMDSGHSDVVLDLLFSEAAERENGHQDCKVLEF